MKNATLFSTMDAEQLREVNGGGFAFDLGRVIRFIGFAGGGSNTTYAILDWIVNDAVNESDGGS